MDIEEIKFHQKKEATGRAPHKPILFLLACKAYMDGYSRLISFEDYYHPRLYELLEFIGNKSPRPEYPFWRMQKDKLWEVVASEKLQVNSAGDVTKKQLIEKKAKAGLTQELYDDLKRNPNQYNHLVSLLINEKIDSEVEVKQYLLNYFVIKLS